MRRDPTAFRERFKNWKETGEYELPRFEGGKEKIDWKRWDNDELTSYTIPFIEDKAITLTNAGVATGARLSTNLLDSLADNAERAKLPLLLALGIGVKESTLGNPTDDKSAWNLSSGIRKSFNNVYPGTRLHINNGSSYIHGEDLINYHKGDTNYQMYNDLYNGVNRKSVILGGFEFYKQHPDKYNPGQKNYRQMVDKRGKEVMLSPEILKWQRERNIRKATGRFNRINPLLKESKFNLPKYNIGKEGNDIETLIKKRLESKSDATTVQRQEPIQHIKRTVGKSVVPQNWIEKKQKEQPVVSQGKNYTQRRILEELQRRTWRSKVADELHGAGEGALFASNFIPFGGELFLGAKALLNNAKSYLTHPFYKTAYHGSPYPFDIKNAWTATANDMGLHASASPSIANSMKESNGVVYKLRIPRENGEIMDLGRNGAEHFDRSRIYKARPYDEFSSNGYYDTTPGDNYRISLLELAGAKPKVVGNKLFTEQDAIINVLDSEFPNIPSYMKPKVYAISHLVKGNKNEYGQVLDLNYAKKLNKQAADILSNSGYKVLKYNNANPFEGGGGLSYMITDPSIIDVMQTVPKGFYNPFIGAIGGTFGNYMYNKYAE